MRSIATACSVREDTELVALPIMRTVVNAMFSSGSKQEARVRHESESVSSALRRLQPQARTTPPADPARLPRSPSRHEMEWKAPKGSSGTAGKSLASSALASCPMRTLPSASPSRNDALRAAGSRAADAIRHWLRSSPSRATIRTVEPEKWRASAASAFDATRTLPSHTPQNPFRAAAPAGISF